MPTKTGLDGLCASLTPIRSNYYSDTYMAKLKVGDVVADWNVVHISLPFSEKKLAEFTRRFGTLSGDALEEYSRDLGRCVKNCIDITSHLAETSAPGIERFASYAIEQKDDGRGSDVYLITKPMEPLSDYFHLNTGDRPTVCELLTCIIRFLQIEKRARAAGVCVGVFDPDTAYVDIAGDATMVLAGGLLYAAKDGDDAVQLPAYLPTHVHPSLLQGARPSMASDIYSACSLAWTLLNGDHYTTEPDLAVAPCYAPAEVVSLLEKGLDPSNVSKSEQEMNELIKTLIRGLYDIIRSIKNDDSVNARVPMAPRLYDENISSTAKAATAVAEQGAEEAMDNAPPASEDSEQDAGEQAAYDDGLKPAETAEEDPAEDVDFPTGTEETGKKRLFRKATSEPVDSDEEEPEPPIAIDEGVLDSKGKRPGKGARFGKILAVAFAAVAACCIMAYVFYNIMS